MDKNQLSTILSALDHAVGEDATRHKFEWINILNNPQINVATANIMLTQTA